MEIDNGLGALFVEPDELEAIKRVGPESEINASCTMSKFVHYRGHHYFRVSLELLPEFEDLLKQSINDELLGPEPERFRSAATLALKQLNNR